MNEIDIINFFKEERELNKLIIDKVTPFVDNSKKIPKYKLFITLKKAMFDYQIEIQVTKHSYEFIVNLKRSGWFQ